MGTLKIPLNSTYSTNKNRYQKSKNFRIGAILKYTSGPNFSEIGSVQLSKLRDRRRRRRRRRRSIFAAVGDVCTNKHSDKQGFYRHEIGAPLTHILIALTINIFTEYVGV